MTEHHHFVFIDPAHLSAARDRARAGDPELKALVDHLVAAADETMSWRIGSVLDKTGVAPSGDKQDFWAMGAYSWRNPNAPDGLPYVYRDGKYNPEAYESSEYDKGEYAKMVAATKTLTLAWYFTDISRYAVRAAEFLRTWLVDPATRMNPNFRHAAARPGVFDGHHSGLIEGVVLIEMLDYVALLRNSPAWSDEDQTEIKKWFLDLSTWYVSSAFGRAEAATINNHSSYYLAQVMAFSMFGGHHRRARAVIPLARRQLRVQIAANGTLPREIGRPNAFYYAVYGLRAFVLLARLGDRYNADIWRFRVNKRREPLLSTALGWLAQYCSGDVEWTLPRYDSGQPADALPMYWMASRAYESLLLARVVEHLSRLDRTDHAQLIYPLASVPGDAEASLFQAPPVIHDTKVARDGAARRVWRKVRAGLIVFRIWPEGRIP
ncbi:alginate lyase family protein [Microbacterium lushaniae]|nr:alginate lyase family protein [Microbacterium lushaniae]KAA9159873.1 alginate lyase family protein [Microbacterium lushaniae]